VSDLLAASPVGLLRSSSELHRQSSQLVGAAEPSSAAAERASVVGAAAMSAAIGRFPRAQAGRLAERASVVAATAREYEDADQTGAANMRNVRV